MNIKLFYLLVFASLSNLMFASDSRGVDLPCYMVDSFGNIRDFTYLCGNSQKTEAPPLAPPISENENITSLEPCPFSPKGVQPRVQPVLAGVDRAGNATCVIPGNGNGPFGRTVVYTSDGKSQEYTVNCRDYTIRPTIMVKHLNPNRSRPDLDTIPSNKNIGEKVMPNTGTIGDGILTGFCNQFWSSQNK